MKIQSNTKTRINRSVREAVVILAAFVWAVATGWLFQFSPVPEPPLPPPEVTRFLADVRMFSLPGWTLALVPLWSLWLDYQAYGRLPALTGWLRRYGLIVVTSLGTALWILIQRDHPDVVAEGVCVSYILLWAIFCMLCVFRKPTE